MNTPFLCLVGPLIFRPMPWFPRRDRFSLAPSTASVVMYLLSSCRFIASPLSAHEMNHWPVAREKGPVHVELDASVGDAFLRDPPQHGLFGVFRDLAVLLPRQQF